MPTSAPDRNAVVLVGGTAGIQALADPANTERLRATGKAGLYIHELGAEMLNKHKLGGDVARIFRDTGPGMAELGLSATRQDAVAFFDTAYRDLYCRWGLRPSMANVNGLDPTGRTGSLQQWTDYAAVAARSGIRSVAPFVNNNNRDWPSNFDDPFWDYTKRVALRMGACALDTPPDFALRSGRNYLGNVLQVIHWCRAHDLRTTVVLSPNGAQDTFLSSTRRFYELLLRDAALPTEWVVENFDDPARPRNPANIVASENRAESTTGVALWMALNARVAPTPAAIAGLTAPARSTAAAAGCAPASAPEPAPEPAPGAAP